MISRRTFFRQLPALIAGVVAAPLLLKKAEQKVKVFSYTHTGRFTSRQCNFVVLDEHEDARNAICALDIERLTLAKLRAQAALRWKYEYRS